MTMTRGWLQLCVPESLVPMRLLSHQQNMSQKPHVQALLRMPVMVNTINLKGHGIT